MLTLTKEAQVNQDVLDVFASIAMQQVTVCILFVYILLKQTIFEGPSLVFWEPPYFQTTTKRDKRHCHRQVISWCTEVLGPIGSCQLCLSSNCFWRGTSTIPQFTPNMVWAFTRVVTLPNNNRTNEIIQQTLSSVQSKRIWYVNKRISLMLSHPENVEVCDCQQYYH